MDLDGLRAFVAVAEELHFGRAALRLGVSQPQVSRRLRALEDELGVELLTRTARQTALTPVGAALLADARELLAAADRLTDKARRGGHGRVSVGFLWSTLSGYLAPLVAAAAEREPGIELQVAQTTYLEILPSLRRGDLDLVISRPLGADLGDIVARELAPDRGVLAVPAEHPLAAREWIGVEDIDGLDFIAMARELVPDAYDAVLARVQRRGLEIAIVRHVRSASEALALVSAGVGVFRIAGSAATPFPGVVYVPMPSVPSRLVVMHRPLVSGSVARIVNLVLATFGDAGSASNDAAATVVSRVGAA